MNEESTRAYPLYWPEGWPRTSQYQIKRARFEDRSVQQGRQEIQAEVRRFGGSGLIVSSNLELRNDGLPRSGQRQPQDRGVAIYFKRDKADMALACDVYSTVEDNLWALYRTLSALRQIERDGSPALINRAFKGFKALPDPDSKEWWEVLGIPRTAGDDEIKEHYRSLARVYHPDNLDTGNDEMFRQVQRAYELATGKAGG